MTDKPCLDRIMGVGVGRLSSAHRLHEVSDLQRQVGSLNDRLRGVSDAIQEVSSSMSNCGFHMYTCFCQILNNELDLRRLELSRFWQVGSYKVFLKCDMCLL